MTDRESVRNQYDAFKKNIQYYYIIATQFKRCNTSALEPTYPPHVVGNLTRSASRVVLVSAFQGVENRRKEGMGGDVHRPVVWYWLYTSGHPVNSSDLTY